MHVYVLSCCTCMYYRVVCIYMLSCYLCMCCRFVCIYAIVCGNPLLLTTHVLLYKVLAVDGILEEYYAFDADDVDHAHAPVCSRVITHAPLCVIVHTNVCMYSHVHTLVCVHSVGVCSAGIVALRVPRIWMTHTAAPWLMLWQRSCLMMCGTHCSLCYCHSHNTWLHTVNTHALHRPTVSVCLTITCTTRSL